MGRREHVADDAYLLLAGGVLNAVLVPLLTRAEASGTQARFVPSLMTLCVAIIAVVTVACTAATPFLVRVMAGRGWSEQQLALAVAFAYLTIPSIACYGVYTVAGQLLAARDRFQAFAWAPVACNVVWIAGLVVFLVTYGPQQGQAALAGFSGSSQMRV